MMRTPPRTRSRSASETRNQSEPIASDLSGVSTEELERELMASLDVLTSDGQLMPPPPACPRPVNRQSA